MSLPTYPNNKTTRSVLEVAYKMTYDGNAAPHIYILTNKSIKKIFGGYNLFIKSY